MDVAELARQIEYKFAPEPLIAVQAFANTFAFEPEEERLRDPSSTRAWLVDSDLAKPEVEVGESEWRRLCRLRDVIRDMLDANLTGAEADEARLRPFVAASPVPLEVGGGGSLALDLEPGASVAGFIAQLLGIVFQAQITGEWDRLKVCASDDCRWAFYDSSRNRGGTWCSMDVCGNRIKNREYRRRRSSAARDSRGRGDSPG